jgi:predicted alpha-1,2-mannosidase
VSRPHDLLAAAKRLASACPRALVLALGFGTLLVGTLDDPGRARSDPATPTIDYAALVRPFAGTESGGVFPGATTPFGMVQYSPNTDHAGGGGYRYSHPRTWGFGTTHLSGPGCPAMGDVVSLPTTSTVRTVDATHEKTTFAHASEQASPGYYAVTLDRSRIRAELSATTRTGWARFSYPSTTHANVIIDPGANFRGVRTAKVHVSGNNTVVGSVSSWGYWNACPTRSHNRYTLYFAMKFNRPFTSFGTGHDNRLSPRRRDARGPDVGAYVSFDSAADPHPVVSKVGISYVDAAGAMRNLDEETGEDFDFDGIQARARAAWNGMLGRVQVSGGSDQQTQTFYTALSRTLLYPNVFSDADGRFEGFDDRVHRAPSGQAQYTSFSMWDTYRTAQQVIDLVAPERVGDMVHSLLEDERESGWLPKWVYAHFDTNEMIGDPAANVIADAYLKGLLHPADVQPAYAALLHNAGDVPKRSPFEGRTGLEDYVNRGFVPYFGHGDYAFSASMSMEYALNDCAIALMADRLGQQADARYFLRRSKRYRGSIDPRTRFARARRDDGSWKKHFHASSRSGFKEGSAWQYTWLVPQDVPGLAAALGGRTAALAKLDQFFAYGAVVANPASIGRLWRSSSHYTPRNEADLQAPYLYDYLGEPWKTQDMVHAAETLYTTAPNGLPGGDDLGTMSGWYVLSALGLYPLMGGDDHYALTTPLFDRAVIAQPAPFGSGGPLVIDAPGASAGLSHIQGASLDGAPLSTSAVSHAALLGGSHHLSFALGASADSGWATGGDAASSACSANPSTADLRLGVRQVRGPRHRAKLQVTVRNAGDAPASGLRIRIRLPGGWSASQGSIAIGALGAGRSTRRTWTLRARAGRTGSVRAEAEWSGGRALRTFASIRARVPRR